MSDNQAETSPPAGGPRLTREDRERAVEEANPQADHRDKKGKSGGGKGKGKGGGGKPGKKGK